MKKAFSFPHSLAASIPPVGRLVAPRNDWSAFQNAATSGALAAKCFREPVGGVFRWNVIGTGLSASR